MRPVDEVRSILGRPDITVVEKKKLVERIKNDTTRASMNQLRNNPFTIDDVTIEVVRAKIIDRCVAVWVEVSCFGDTIELPEDALPLMFGNPPLLHEGHDDGKTIAQFILYDVIRSVI